MAVAIIELVSRQLISGVVRMVYAIVYSFLLGYGIEMGSEIFGTIDPDVLNPQSAGRIQYDKTCAPENAVATAIDKWFYFMTVPLFAVSYCLYLRARPPRWPVMITVAACGFVTNFVLSNYANAPSQVLQVVPAFVVGLLGNILSKFTGQMSLDAVILGVSCMILSLKQSYINSYFDFLQIFYLVPGSLG